MVFNARSSTKQWVAQYNRREASLRNLVNSICQDISTSTQNSSPEELCTPVNIICMDGGGMLGFSLLAMIQELQEINGGKDFSVHFDLLAGTSVGVVAALMGAHAGTSAGNACQIGLDILQRVRDEAFSKWNVVKLLKEGSLLHNDNRKDILKDVVGDSRLLISDVNHLKAFAVCVTKTQEGTQETNATASTSSNSKKGEMASSLYEPFLARTYRAQVQDSYTEVTAESDQHLEHQPPADFLPGTSDLHLWEAFTETSAVPFLCDRTRVHADGVQKILADGVVISNSPVAIAIQEARALWPQRSIGIILSFGTGDDHETDLNLEAVEKLRKYGSQDLTYLRLVPPNPPNHALNTNPEATWKLECAAREFIRNSKEAKTVLDKVMATPIRRCPPDVSSRNKPAKGVEDVSSEAFS